MFVDAILERNSELVEYAIHLHQNGHILPDTYVIDVDTVLNNAKMLLDEAKSNHLKCVYMSKQFGRNAQICRKLEEMGFDGAVAVDFKEVQMIMDHQLKLYNVGHLVQIPNSMLRKVISYGVEYITIYSLEKAELIDSICKELNKNQKIMLKVLDSQSVIYDGQQSGFSFEESIEIAKKIQRLDNLVLAGVTSFPCLMYNAGTSKIEKTSNFDLVIRVKEALELMGFTIEEVNTPSSNTISAMSNVAFWGGTTVEPGHALTGTTPFHAKFFQGENIAICYVSEISHHYNKQSYCFGGGHYRRSNMSKAIIAHKQDRLITSIAGPAQENIDYHFVMSGIHPIGSTVVASFRTQIFTTRSYVVLVENLKSNPKIIGTFDSQGRKL